MRVRYNDPFIRDAIAEDDRLRAERERQASPPVRETEPEGLVDKDYDNVPQHAAAGADDMPPLFGDERDELLVEAMGTVIDAQRREWRREIAKLKKDLTALRRQVDLDRNNGIEIVCTGIERRFALLEAENVELRSMLGEVLTRFVEHQRGEPSADVLELPNWRRRDAA